MTFPDGCHVCCLISSLYNGKASVTLTEEEFDYIENVYQAAFVLALGTLLTKASSFFMKFYIRVDSVLICSLLQIYSL